MSETNGENLISLQNLQVFFKLGGGLFRETKYVKAVDGVTLNIKKGETLGLVGESGCGKSTLGKAILRLTEPTGGQVFYHGKDLANASNSEMREQRKNLQMIFQDPYASLNPRMTVGNIIGEPIRTFGLAKGGNVSEMVQDLMETVGLSRRFIKRYPHEFSGGQRQRIGIARALAVDPEFIVADEPISALDVSIQAQIMNLMEELQKEKNSNLSFHLARSSRRASSVGSGGGDVSRRDRRTRRRQGNLRRPVDAVYAGSDLRRSRSRPGDRSQTRTHHPDGRCPVADQSAVGLSFPHALSVCD